MERSSLKLALIRHTSLQIQPGICYGQTDVDVAVSFVDEAAATRAKIKHLELDAVFTSPLQRCVKLASALGFVDARHDDRLKELHFGDWEMQAWDDVPRNYFDEWAQNYGHMAPPNGETFAQLQARGVTFINELLNQYHLRHVLIVTHGGMIRALVAHVLNMQLKGLFRINVDYGSVTELDFSEDIPRINYVNR
ncbi:MAG TPA: alpha-ribazole phosphatase [Methylophilaceae bacterium]|nr:alpha-ribazole phosphatase [Methylophilaceae bacterium]